MCDEFRDAVLNKLAAPTKEPPSLGRRLNQVVSRITHSVRPLRRRGGGSHDELHDGVDEHHVALAAALKRARDAVAALAEPSPTFMDGMRSALQQAERRRCSSSREEGGRGGMN